MDEIFGAILAAQRATAITLDQVGRIPPCSLGVVTNNNDPEKKRKITISSPFIPGLDSDWIRRIPLIAGYDPPVPEIGQTVLILSVAGDFLNSYYMVVNNDTNPPIPGKKDQLLDSYQQIKGNLTTETQKDLVLFAGDSIKLSTSSGSSLELTKDGKIRLTDAGGNILVLNNTDVTIANKSVAVVGALDNGGDVLINPGR